MALSLQGQGQAREGGGDSVSWLEQNMQMYETDATGQEAAQELARGWSHTSAPIRLMAGALGSAVRVGSMLTSEARQVSGRTGCDTDSAG